MDALGCMGWLSARSADKQTLSYLAGTFSFRMTRVSVGINGANGCDVAAATSRSIACSAITRGCASIKASIVPSIRSLRDSGWSSWAMKTT